MRSALFVVALSLAFALAFFAAFFVRVLLHFLFAALVLLVVLVSLLAPLDGVDHSVVLVMHDVTEDMLGELAVLLAP